MPYMPTYAAQQHLHQCRTLSPTMCWTVTLRWCDCRSDTFTHQCSIADRGGCFQRCLFVCQSVCHFVCLFVNDDETWHLGALYKNLARVPMSRSKFMVIRDKKRKCVAFCLDVILWDEVVMWHFFGSGPQGRGPLHQWENQRMLSSLHIASSKHCLLYQLLHG